MVKVFNIRGTNGSGKSTLVRTLLGERIVESFPEHPKITFGTKAHAVGHYKTACGGCDTIKTQEEVKTVINQFRLVSAVEGLGNELWRNPLLFEGVLISTIYQPWVDFDKKIGGMTWCYLDTPLDVCVQRIYQRNGGKEINEKLVKDKYRTIQRTMEKAKGDGLNVVVLDHKDAVNQLRELMK